MEPSVSGAWKLLIWAMWDDRLLLITWVVVDVEWPLTYDGHYVWYMFCCDNLWKSIIMALEKPGKLGFFSPTLWPPWKCTELYLFVQVRLTFLDYINDLAMSLDSDELSNTPCVQQVVMRVIAWASEPKCARIRQVTPLHHHLLQMSNRFFLVNLVMAALCNRGPLYFCPLISIFYISIFYLFFLA